MKLIITDLDKRSLGEFRHTWSDHKADIIADNALEAVMAILKEEK